MEAISKPSSRFSARRAARPLPIGRAFPHPQAAVGGADGLFPGAGMGSQVVHAEAAACLLDHLGDGFGDLTLVESSLAAFGDLAQGARQTLGCGKSHLPEGRAHRWSSLSHLGHCSGVGYCAPKNKR